MKVALTVAPLAPTVIEQVGPEQSPPKPPNRLLMPGVGTRSTVSPSKISAAQLAPQSMRPTGDDATVPAPPPVMSTVRVRLLVHNMLCGWQPEPASQSSSAMQLVPSAQPFAHVPPQSMPSSKPFCVPSLHEGATQILPWQLCDMQSAPSVQSAPLPQGAQPVPAAATVDVRLALVLNAIGAARVEAHPGDTHERAAVAGRHAGLAHAARCTLGAAAVGRRLAAVEHAVGARRRHAQTSGDVANGRRHTVGGAGTAGARGTTVRANASAVDTRLRAIAHAIATVRDLAHTAGAHANWHNRRRSCSHRRRRRG